MLYFLPLASEEEVLLIFIAWTGSKYALPFFLVQKQSSVFSSALCV